MLKKKIRSIAFLVLAMVTVFSFTTTVFAASSIWSDFPLTKQGNRGDFTWAAQLVLKFNNVKGTTQAYLAGSLDGIFGGDTFNATTKFQNDYDLDADGIIGQNTWKELRNRLIITSSMSYYTNYRPGTKTTADYFEYSSPIWTYKRTSSGSWRTLKS
jgi:hypothetical protein